MSDEPLPTEIAQRRRSRVRFQIGLVALYLLFLGITFIVVPKFIPFDYVREMQMQSPPVIVRWVDEFARCFRTYLGIWLAVFAALFLLARLGLLDRVLPMFNRLLIIVGVVIVGVTVFAYFNLQQSVADMIDKLHSG